MPVHFEHWVSDLRAGKYHDFDEFSAAFSGEATDKKEIIKQWLGYKNMEEIVIAGVKFTKNYLTQQAQPDEKDEKYEYIIYDGTPISTEVSTSLRMIVRPENLTEILLALPNECKLDFIHQFDRKQLANLYPTATALIATLQALDDQYHEEKKLNSRLHEDKRTAESLAQLLGLDHLQTIINKEEEVDEIVRLIDHHSKYHVEKKEKSTDNALFLKAKEEALCKLNEGTHEVLLHFLDDFKKKEPEKNEIIKSWLGYQDLHDRIDSKFMINEKGDWIVFDKNHLISKRKDDAFKAMFYSYAELKEVLLALPIECRLDLMNRFSPRELNQLIPDAEALFHMLAIFQEDPRQSKLLLTKLTDGDDLHLIIKTSLDLDKIMQPFNLSTFRENLLTALTKNMNRKDLKNFTQSRHYPMLKNAYHHFHPGFIQKTLTAIKRLFSKKEKV